MVELQIKEKVVDKLFREASEQGASDIHLAVGTPPTLRINGKLVELAQYGDLTPNGAKELVVSILNELQWAQFEKERELDLSYALPDNSVRFRVNVHWEKERVGLVARLVPDHIPTMEEIDLPSIAYDMVKDNQGLILITGPTGSGKSTTMAAMIERINQESAVHIVTLEDPIEFLFTPKKALIRQRQLHSDFTSFPEALKHVVRQDPNVIMVGEMRDLETVAAALTVAETGHLVFATLHTLNAAQTVDRIVDIFPTNQQDQVRLQLSMVLKGVISQQLLPAKAGGRIAAREILITSPAVANLIRENNIPQIQTAIQTGAASGMVSLDQAILKLYEDGKVEKSVAQIYMSNPERLDQEK